MCAESSVRVPHIWQNEGTQALSLGKKPGYGAERTPWRLDAPVGEKARYFASLAAALFIAKPAAQPMKPPAMWANCETLSAVRPATTSRPM